MRRAAILGAALLLVGCGSEVEEEPLADPLFEGHWPGHVAVNEQFRIQASFPEDEPVCVSQSGRQVQGFYQWRGGDCADPEQQTGRFISVYASYNNALNTWDEAAATYCSTDTEPFDLGMEANGSGRFSACVPRLCGEQYVITAVYLSDSPQLVLGDETVGGGPDLIYMIALGTTDETQEADLAEFRTFLSQLRLDGGGFELREGQSPGGSSMRSP